MHRGESGMGTENCGSVEVERRSGAMVSFVTDCCEHRFSCEADYPDILPAHLSFSV